MILAVAVVGTVTVAGCASKANAQVLCPTATVQLDPSQPELAALGEEYRDWLEFYLRGPLRVPAGEDCRLHVRLNPGAGGARYSWDLTVERRSPAAGAPPRPEVLQRVMPQAAIVRALSDLTGEKTLSDRSGGLTEMLSENDLRELFCAGTKLELAPPVERAEIRSLLIEERTRFLDSSCESCGAVLEALEPDFVEFESKPSVYANYRAAQGSAGEQGARQEERQGRLGFDIKSAGLHRVEVREGPRGSHTYVARPVPASEAAARLRIDRRSFSYGGYSVTISEAEVTKRDGGRLGRFRNATFDRQVASWRHPTAPDWFACSADAPDILNFLRNFRSKAEVL
jgi:hypothetical protein